MPHYALWIKISTLKYEWCIYIKSFSYFLKDGEEQVLQTQHQSKSEPKIVLVPYHWWNGPSKTQLATFYYKYKGKINATCTCIKYNIGMFPNFESSGYKVVIAKKIDIKQT